MSKLKELKQKFQRAKPSEVSLFVSEDQYLLKESEAVFSKALESFYPEADVLVHYADQLDIEAFSDDLSTLSLFSDFKVIKIKNAESLNDSALEVLLNSLKVGNKEQMCFALFFKKLDKRKKMFKELVKLSEFFELKAPYENQMSQWIMDLAKEKKLTLTSGASETLHHLVGDSLTEISDSLDRLKDLHGNVKINSELVNESVSLKRENSAFKICDYMGSCDFTAASLEIDLSLAAKASSIGVLHLLLRHFNILIKIKTNTSKSASDLAKQVGVAHFFLKNYQAQSRFWSLEKLKKAWAVLLETDQSLKSSKLKEETLLANMLIQITAIYSEVKS